MAEVQAPESQPAPGELAPGTQIGRYRVEAVAGRGGMGTVYRAFDEETKREVALKVLSPGLSPTLQERFLAECEAEARIRHPHVMPVYDRGHFAGDRLYFVMELVYEPITLTEVVEAARKGTLPQTWPRIRHWADPGRLILDVMVPLAEGVDAANRRYDTLHRDLKPDNVLIDVRTRRAYLIDFGICHRLGEEVDRKKIIGTPRFLSPEQARGAVDGTTDVWGLGALLHYVLEGEPPLEAAATWTRKEKKQRVEVLAKEIEEARARGLEERVAELETRHRDLLDPGHRTVEDLLADARDGRYLPLSPSVPTALAAVVRKAMARDPIARYPDAGALSRDLAAWATGGRVLAHEEVDRTGAALDRARRVLRRHAVQVTCVAIGLLLGFVLAHGLVLKDRRAAIRAPASAEASLAALETEVAHLEAARALPAVQPPLHHALSRRVAVLKAEVLRWTSAADRGAAVRRLDDLLQRLATPAVEVALPAGTAWVVQGALPLGDARATPLAPGPNVLPPGAWVASPAEQARAGVPFLVPQMAASAAPRLDLSRAPARIPDGMVFVPARSAGLPEERVHAFFLDETEVSNLDYAEWLDELEVVERRRRRPLTGFVEDRETPGRLVVQPGREDDPVVGVRPEDAAAFAAWRRETYGVPCRLPTTAEWRHAAGGGMVDALHAVFFTAPHLAPGRRAIRDRGPYGARGLFTRPSELVQEAEGGPYLVVGPGDAWSTPPSALALGLARPADPATPLPEVGFRLVEEVR